MLKKYFFLSFTLSAIVILTGWMLVRAESTTGQNHFPRNLYVGMSGDDVLLLQRTLNTIKESKIAESGPGSPGNETNYFGIKTKQAVVRFQELYATDILTPVGLVRGTGMVGAQTRAKLKSVLTKNQSSAIPQKTPTQAPQIETSNVKEPLVLYRLEPTHGPNGTVVKIVGSGFTKSNEIWTSYDTIYGVAKDASGQILFTVNFPNLPKKSSYFQKLPIKIFVRNENGTSKALDYIIEP